MKLPIVIAVAFTIMAAACPSLAGEDLSVRRFALIAAANDGGPDRGRLRYAETDARAFARVLRGIGGVAPEDHRILVQPTRADLQAALTDMGARLSAAKDSARRLELIVYYSGHSDAEGLLLGGQRFAYRALKAALAELPADVRIAILDSCASGAMTRVKGGVRRPPFTVDAANRVSGYAVLTSSSEDEAAQESDRIGASFFTHALVSGLRGAGDLSQDGRVTLNEAYNFAFHETLARTENTRGGAQHAAYDIQLVGTGDVVMTDLRATTARLALDEYASGRVFIRDGEGRLAVELRKMAGRPVTLGLEPGTYSVVLDQDGRRFGGRVTIASGREVTLDVAGLDELEGEATTLRGGPAPAVKRRRVPFSLSIVPALSTNGDDDPVVNNVSLSFALSHAYDVEGFALSLGANWLEHDLKGVQSAIGFNRVGATAIGAQWAVGANFAGRLRGAQASVGLNVVASNSRGAQLATGANIANGDLLGAQMAVGFNYGRRIDGVQASSALNVAGALNGAQMGIVNVVSSDASGLQLGLINYGASVAGLQLGLINVVDRTEGVSLGLVNYAVDDGIFDVHLYTSDVALGGVAVALGTRTVYTSFSASTGTWQAQDAVSFGLHLGGRFVLSERWQARFEVGSSQVFAERDFSDGDILNSARLTVDYRIFDGFKFFVGPTFNVLVDLKDGTAAERNPLAPSYASRPEDDRVYLWPGLIAGLQVF